MPKYRVNFMRTVYYEVTLDVDDEAEAYRIVQDDWQDCVWDAEVVDHGDPDIEEVTLVEEGDE